jgi:hypothetical protein
MGRVTLPPRLAAYAQAAAEFRACAERIPSAGWEEPRSAGKWSPAEETEHIVLSHELFLSQLHGGPPMRAITTGWKRAALHWLVLPFILGTGRFPRGARAPRESRPVGVGAGREELLLRLDRAVHGVIDTVQRDEARLATQRLLHPYFGRMRIPQVVELSTLHTKHHATSMSAGLSRSAAGATQVR